MNEPTRPTEATQPRFEDLGVPLFTATFAVLDLETTGLSATRDRITEVGVVKVQGGQVQGELQSFVHPGRSIPPSVTAVTGITDAMVADAPTFAAIGPTLRRFLDGAILVAHNAAFDLGFLRAAFEGLGYPTYDPAVVDTARLARRLLRDEVPNVRLETVARHLRSHHTPTHRALADARATVDVLHGLIERSGPLGATTVEDLQELTRSRSDRRFRRISLVRDAPTTCGVYRFLDARGEVLYVGKATDLRSRLRSYFGSDRRRRIEDLVRETAEVNWTPTATLIEAEVRELREIRAAQPRYNRRSKRAPTPAYIAMTREPFPRLSVVRRPRDTHLATLGPFPTRKLAEQAVDALQEAFPIRGCTPRLRLAQDHGACIAKELGRCVAPCDGSVDREGYGEVVTAVLDAFVDPTPVLVTLRERMHALAASGRFERASAVRQQLHTVGRCWRAIQRRRALVEVEELVVERGAPGSGSHGEVVVMRRGRLWTSVTTSSSPPGASTPGSSIPVASGSAAPTLPGLAAIRADGGPPRPAAGSESAASDPTEDHEEIDLLLGWIGNGPVRVRESAGVYAEPIAGSRLLADLEEEARKVARTVRRDRQVLSGVKVRPRGSDGELRDRERRDAERRSA